MLLRLGPGRARRLAVPILFYVRGCVGAIEVKGGKTAKFQQGQKLTLDRFSEWSPFIYVAYPQNWPEIKNSLTKLFF
jgi:hypothetical protein